MGSILATILSILAEVAGVASTASTVGKIIAALVEVLPILVKEYRDLVGPVKGIIAALKSNGAVTPEQLAELDAIEAKVDADFEAAAAAAVAEDDAAASDKS